MIFKNESLKLKKKYLNMCPLQHVFQVPCRKYKNLFCQNADPRIYVSLGSLVAGILLTTDKLQQAVTPSVATRILRAHLTKTTAMWTGELVKETALHKEWHLLHSLLCTLGEMSILKMLLGSDFFFSL